MEECDLELICPPHLELVSNGHGEYPDTYRVTKAGLEKIKSFFEIIKNIKDEQDTKIY